MDPEVLKAIEASLKKGNSIDDIKAKLKSVGYSDEELSSIDEIYKKKRPSESQSTSVPTQDTSASRGPAQATTVDPKQIESIKLEPSQDTPAFLQEAKKEQDRAAEPVVESLKKRPEYNKRMSGATAVEIVGKINSANDISELSSEEFQSAFSTYREFKAKSGEEIPFTEINEENFSTIADTLERDADDFSETRLKEIISRESGGIIGKQAKTMMQGSMLYLYDFTKELVRKNAFDLLGAEAMVSVDMATRETSSSLRDKALTASKQASAASQAYMLKSGYTEEQIEKGSFLTAMEGDFGMLGIQLMTQIPNLMVGAVPVVGPYLVGASAAGAGYVDAIGDEGFTEQEALVYGTGLGIVEVITEKIFQTDVASIRRIFGGKTVPKNVISDTMFSWVPKGLKNNYAVKFLKGSTENAIEEAIVSTTEQIMGAVMAGREIDPMQIVESAWIGAAMGGSISAVVNAPSALLSTAKSANKIKIDSKISKINEMLQDDSISESEKEILRDELKLATGKRNQMRRDAVRYYEQFSENDMQETVAANQSIKAAYEAYNESSIPEVKDGALKQIKEAVAKKKAIEQKYADQRVEAPKKFVSSIDGGVIQKAVEAMEKRMQDAEAIDISELESTAESLIKAYEAAEADKSLRPREKAAIMDAIEAKINELLDYELATTTRTKESTETTTTRGVIPAPKEGVRQTVSRERFEGKAAEVDGKPAKIEKDGEVLSLVSEDGTEKPIDFNFVEFDSSSLDADGNLSVTLRDNRDGSTFTIKDNDLALDIAISESQRQIGTVPEGTFQQVMRQVAKTTKSQETVFVNEGRAPSESALKGRRKKSYSVTEENASEVIDELSDQLDDIPDEDFKRLGTSRSKARAGLISIESVMASLAKAGRKASLTIHASEKSFLEAVGGNELSRGMHVVSSDGSSQIHIYLPAMIENTAYHEAMHELIPDVFGERAINRMAARLLTEINKDSYLAVKFNKFLESYKGSEKADELITEVAAMVASGDIEIKVKQSVIRKFVNAMADIFGFKVNPNVDQMVEALDFMANRLSEGGEIDVAEAKKMARTDRAVGQKIGSKAQDVIKTKEVSVEYAPKGNYLNVGMVAGTTNQPVTSQMITDALPSDVSVEDSFIKDAQKSELDGQESEEPTMVLKLSRPLTDNEMQALLDATDQIAIPAIYDGVGQLFGSDRWGDFNPEFFSMLDGNSLESMDGSSMESFVRDIMTEPNTGSAAGNFNIKKSQRIAPSIEDDPRGFVRSFVKTINLEELNGREFITSMYDQTTAGNVLFPSGAQIDLFGGANYVPFMLARNGRKIGDVSNISAFNGENYALDFIRNAKESGATLFASTAGGDGSWQFQSRLFTQVIGLLRSSGKFSDSKILDILNSGMKMTPNKKGVMTYRKYSENKKNVFENLSMLAKAKGVQMKNLNSYRGRLDELITDLEATGGNMAPDLRKDVIGILIGDESVRSLLGIKNQISFYRSIIDPMNVGAKFGDIMSVVEFDPSTLEVRKTKEGDLDHHDSFGWTVYGKVNGIYRPNSFHQVTESTESVVKFNKNSTVQYDISQKEFYNQFAGSASSQLKVGKVELKKAQAITPETSANYANLTEDSNGNFVFYHFSDQNFDAPDPSRAGQNRSNITSREEKAALSTAGPVAMFYTDINNREGLVSSEFGYEVRVPAERVYDLDADPLNFEAEARERFKKDNPDQAFGASHRAFAITAVAAENGFDMTVGRWTRGLSRAHSAIKLPVTDRMVARGKNKKGFNESFESNSDKGWAGVSPSDGMSKVYDAYSAISMERNEQKKYDEVYRLYYEYGKYSQDEITDMINSSDLSSESKKLYKDALASVPSGYQSVQRKAQAISRKAQGPIKDIKTVELAQTAVLWGTKRKDGGYDMPMTEDDYVYSMIGILPENQARGVYKSVKNGSAFVDNVEAAKRSLDELQKKLEAQEKTKFEKTLSGFIDSQRDLKKLLIKARMSGAYSLLVTRAGHGNIAKLFTTRYEKDVYKGLSKEEIQALDKIVFARRVIQVDTNADAQGKERPMHPAGPKDEFLTKESAEMSLLTIERNLGTEVYEKLLDRSDRYFNAFRAMLKRSYDSGIITEESYNMFVGFDYQPRRFFEHIIDFGEHMPSDFKAGAQQNLLKAIKNGSFDPAIMDSRYLMVVYAKSLEARIANNNVRKVVAEAALDDKNKDWARVTKSSSKTPSQLQDVPNGWVLVNFFDKGVQDAFLLREDLFPQISNAGRVEMINHDLATKISWFSGSRILKTIATATNPLFILAELPRNYWHVLLFTDIYDGMDIFSAGAKLAIDASKGIYEHVRKTPLYEDWIMHGGGMDFLATQGRESVIGIAGQRVGNTLSFLGETSEAAFRIAVYQRTLSKMSKENGGVVTEEMKVHAAAKSREVIDFAQGGTVTKELENVMPYVNAAFQGFRVATNYIANNPAMFAAKIAQVSVGVLGLAVLNMSMADEDELEKISGYIKKNYFVILTPNRDKEGKRVYLKIAKTQQARVFLTPIENIMYGAAAEITGKKMRKNYHGEYNDVGDALIQVSETYLPVDVLDASRLASSINPILGGFLTYNSNYDSFRDQVIARDMGVVMPQLEGIENPNIPVFYKVIGEMTSRMSPSGEGLSPARLKAAVEKVITSPSSSLTVGVAYSMLDLVTRQFDVEIDGSISNFKINETSNPAAISLWQNVQKKVVGRVDDRYQSTNFRKEFESIDMRAGSKRKEIDILAKRIGQEYSDSGYSKEAASRVKAEFKDAMGKMKDDTDIKYAVSRMNAVISKKNYPPVYDDIRWSTSDRARAEKIMVVTGKMSKNELTDFYKRVAAESGYSLPAATIYEYKKLAGIK